MIPCRCENDILELEIELQSRDDAIEALNKKVANASRDSEDTKSEFIATRALVQQLTGMRLVSEVFSGFEM